MNQCAMGVKESRKSNLWAVDTAVPNYIRMIYQDKEALFDWMEYGIPLTGNLASADAKWLRETCEQLRRVGEKAARWLSVDGETLLQQPLDGLDDLELAAYAGVLFERDSEFPYHSNQSEPNPSQQRIYAAYDALIRNPEGCALMDYSWLYGDIMEYELVEDEASMLRLNEIALAYEVRTADSKRIRSCLSRFVANQIEYGDLDEGVRNLSRLLENFAGDFDVFEHAASACLRVEEYTMARLIQKELQRMPKSKNDAHFFEDLCMMFPSHRGPTIATTQLEKRLQRALLHPAKAAERLSETAMALELVPHLHSIPAKVI